jgi:nicotinamidase-related amidase
VSYGRGSPRHDRGPDRRRRAIALDLTELLAPEHTALVTIEVQDGVVGEDSLLPDLASAAEPILPRIAALARAARAAGVPVMHCTADARSDGLGANRNARLFGAMRKRGIAADSRGRVHDAVGAADGDLVLGRLHGVSPMTGTSLDSVLRNSGVTTIVATGVSVNVAVLGFAFEAVNYAYQLVIPRDAVAGVDDVYVNAVFDRTLSLLATVTTTDAVLERWTQSTA